MGLPADLSPADAVRRALEHYAAQYPDHPMTAVLTEGLADPAAGGARRKRRGRGRTDPGAA